MTPLEQQVVKLLEVTGQPNVLSAIEYIKQLQSPLPSKSAEEIWIDNSRSIPEDFEGELGDILEDYPEINFVVGKSVMLKEDFLAAMSEYRSQQQGGE